MKKIIVLGSGMVGSAIAIDLAQKHEVTVTDVSEKALAGVRNKNSEIKTHVLDASDTSELQNTIRPFDLVVCAVPGFMGFNTLRNIIEAGKDVIDISFFPENSMDLQMLAKENNVTAIVDCGVAPGMDNIILGHYNEIMELTSFECLVGGLPKVKKWPFSYKAPFSPIDVIEEYIRPARYVENGHEVIKPALSDCEYVEFDKVGTLESFNTDGLRSIIHTMSHIPDMKEKTLRYPGHVELVKALKSSGFFGTKEVMLDDAQVRPLDVTCKILFDEWKLGNEEPEFTVMRVTVVGTHNGVDKKIVYDLYDEYDPTTKTSSMARTTGYTATAAANMFLEGVFTQKGLFPPELVGKHKACFDYFLNYLKDRNVIYKRREEVLAADL